MTKHLTIKQKREWLPILIEWYGGFCCFYCKRELDHKSIVFEHLNDNSNDNRIENVVPSCQSCNNTKPDNAEMQVVAKDQLSINEKSNFMRERKNEIEEKEIPTEIEINQANFEIVEQFISEQISADGFIEFTDTLNSCTYLCKKKTNFGSQQSIRNYINTLTSSVAPFQIIKNENKKKVIVRRTGT